MVTDAAGAAKLRALLPVMRVTHERDPVPLTPLESGSRTSAAAVKLLTKSGGGRGGSQVGVTGSHRGSPRMEQLIVAGTTESNR